MTRRDNLSETSVPPSPRKPTKQSGIANRLSESDGRRTLRTQDASDQPQYRGDAAYKNEYPGMPNHDSGKKALRKSISKRNGER